MSLDLVVEKIKARVAAVDPNGPRKVLGVFQLNVNIEGSIEQLTVDLKQLKVEKGPASGADVTVTLSLEDLLAIHSRTLTIEDAVKQGKLQVEGDASLATKLAEVI
ncbi:uncharacterized protein LOC129762846 [Toxorhynchites rutilus septentrionalis]|uniref:uncharacterized protein LOC129762846 n=1 Tax=Toxorhynchites rutilus septentrionalis TaxID=329112 RepID=UPI002479C5C7|nr:uncharacterized protein LOC129762846 [Toxorhynchites rutilus septentrionalis]